MRGIRLRLLRLIGIAIALLAIRVPFFDFPAGFPHHSDSDGRYQLARALRPPAKTDRPSVDDVCLQLQLVPRRDNGCRGRLSIGDRLKVPYYRNYPLGKRNFTATRAIVVIHGRLRNPNRVFRSIVTAAEKVGKLETTIILAPYFMNEEDDPAADELYWRKSGWVRGDRSTRNLSPRVSSYEIMDLILQRLGNRQNFPNLRTIAVIGHSAGGQFTQRYAAGNQIEQKLLGIRVKYVVANPSSYLYLSDRRFWLSNGTDCDYNSYKYGLEDRNSYMRRLSTGEIVDRYRRRNVVYLLGDRDVQSDRFLSQTCAANLQGPNRYLRGRTYMGYMNRFFRPHNHRMVVVNDVGHNSHAMYTSAQGLAVLFD